METIKKTVNKAVNKRNVNKEKNSSKLAQTKSINLLDEAKKETKKQNKLETVKTKVKNKASYTNCVVETNRLMKEECNKLGYALKLFIDCKGINLTNRPLSDKFTEFDRIKMTAIYEIIELARKDSKLYKFIESIDKIQTSKGKFVPYYVGQKLFKEKRELMLTKYVNSNIQEREIFTFEH
jgi:hypothetical protein